MPSGGPVLSYPITQGPGGQGAFVESVAQSPGDGSTPTEIVLGFLTASASIGNQQLEQQYLTPEFSKSWNPGWTATVFLNRGVQSYSPVNDHDPKQKTATVTIGGKVVANLAGNGLYAVPSASAQRVQSAVFHLVKNSDGQWRIASITGSEPIGLLLTTQQFSDDYQQRNLYFFDPTGKYLVPDPVYVPLQDTAADLMQKLVNDLNEPPGDWLNGATTTAFPQGTKVGDVTLDGGGATVNLSGTKIGKAGELTMEQVSSQLLSTLVGSGQTGPAVKTVVVVVNGHTWAPKGSQGNPVQSTAKFRPPPRAQSGVFYYLDSAGNLMDQVRPGATPVLIQQGIGKQYSQIAISSGLNGPYIAALRGTTLFIGPVGGRLTQRGGSTGFSSMSWDPNGDLWAATVGNQIVKLRGDASPGAPGFQPVVYTVPGIASIEQISTIRVAPDGVRVALIVGDSAVNIGAIDSGSHQIRLSPFSVPVPQGTTMFTAVSWYGPDNVITLGAPGQTLTEYPVNGGSSTSIPPPPAGVQSITASVDYPLIAGVAKGGLWADASLTEGWTSVNLGKDKLITPPVYPG
jgi:hypothetical protein